jgi:recombinational DNA repair ATPase RecF
MRVEQVGAEAFGPLSGATLELADGMTVVFGPNEAGKSSWHGALYAGVCGVRRGKGRRSASDEAFETRHRPWGGGRWGAAAVVALADGRRVELTQDLSARSGVARDQATGRELTSQILSDQTPDASRWLGLDRDAFRAVACVPQTALLQILEHPGQLAEHLQRAAATAGTDATAAEAIKRIEDFSAERVGSERAWTKPLAKAKVEVSTATVAVRQAEQEHADMVGLRGDVREASLTRAAAENRLRCAEAAIARRRAKAAHDLWKQAADLAARYPQPPPPLVADDALAQQIRAAMDGYRSRPAASVPEGLDAAALEADLAALPLPPSGDVKPAPVAESAYEAVRQARANLESVAALEPALVTMPENAPADTSQLRRLADALGEPLPEAGQAPEQPAGDERNAGHRPSSSPLLRPAVAAAVILLLAGIVVGVAARQPLGWALAGVGVVIGAAVIISLLRDRSRRIAAMEELQTGGTAWAVRKAAEQRLADAQCQAVDMGWPADPKALREMADDADRAHAAARQHSDWEPRRSTASTVFEQALAKLGAELSARGVRLTGNLGEDFQHYREECAQRSQQAAQAARRPDLQARLDARRQAEAQAADAMLRRFSAEKSLHAAASSCGLADADTADPGILLAALQSWLQQREHTLGQRQQATGDYAVLQKLLDGRTVADVQQEADRLTALAAAAAVNLDPAEIATPDLGPDAEETVRVLRGSAQQARDRLTGLRTTEEERQRGAPSVAAAQEAVAQATVRVEQLMRLGRILSSAHEFLMRAQENVHRSIAPQLADAIAPHLATVTGNRYTEARVDPDGLQVLVRPSSGTWREAARLSHGTAEQVYLLLRAALAQYLVTTGEPCPLILDDPTAYADATRTSAVLQVLHVISAERQIVVFSHDAQVLEWARHALTGPCDKLVELVGSMPV